MILASNRVPGQYMQPKPLSGVLGGKLTYPILGALGGSLSGALLGYLGANWTGNGSKASKAAKGTAVVSAVGWGVAAYKEPGYIIPTAIVPIVLCIPLGVLAAITASWRKK